MMIMRAPTSAALEPPAPPSRLTDVELLERFASWNDEEAFATLVHRYGPLVLGVCRRVLHHVQDTEDAFQATFFVLARKARSISRKESVRSWLYKVAYRIALRARAAGTRHRDLEKHIIPKEATPSLAEVCQRELAALLDEEVQRLPEKYRAPVLLCYLQGQTNEQAAEQLHWPTGTVKIRLLRARELLRKRLVRRGIALSTAALLPLLLENLAAAVPPNLAETAVRGASQGAVPSSVAKLADGVLRRMCLTKLKVAAAVLLTLLVGCLADVLSQRAFGADPPTVKAPPAPSIPAPTNPYPETPSEFHIRHPNPPRQNLRVEVSPARLNPPTPASTSSTK
jgi:RNA polymerase sigma factor (sigma-70 family)